MTNEKANSTVSCPQTNKPCSILTEVKYQKKTTSKRNTSKFLWYSKSLELNRNCKKTYVLRSNTRRRRIVPNKRSEAWILRSDPVPSPSPSSFSQILRRQNTTDPERLLRDNIIDRWRQTRVSLGEPFWKQSWGRVPIYSPEYIFLVFVCVCIVRRTS